MTQPGAAAHAAPLARAANPGRRRAPARGPLGTIDHLGTPLAGSFQRNAQIGVICWNAAKCSGDEFLEALRELQSHARSNGDGGAALLLLQEARAHMGHGTEGVASFAHSWSDSSGELNGVMTLSTVAPEANSTNQPSRRRELGVASTKNCLITRYALEASDPSSHQHLTVVNFHGINFRATNRPFGEQLARLAETLAEESGPLLVGGDFNTWQRSRMSALLRFARDLGLRRVRPGSGAGARAEHRFARLFGRLFRLDRHLHLDHLFFRGLELADGEDCAPRWLEDVEHSDHVPLYAVLRVPDSSATLAQG